MSDVLHVLVSVNSQIIPISRGPCSDALALPPFSMAFQPIVNIETRTVFAYEALARGPSGEPAASVFKCLTPDAPPNLRYQLDRALRIRAIELGTALGIHERGAKLSINFMPGAIYDPETGLLSTLRAAQENNFPHQSIIFELLEDERISDLPHLRRIIAAFHKEGFHLALDDFGSAFSNLNILSEIVVDIVKLDAALIRDIHTSPRLRSILSHTVAMCASLGSTVIAEAIETPEEYHALRACGVTLMQGYLFARPAFEALPPVNWPS